MANSNDNSVRTLKFVMFYFSVVVLVANIWLSQHPSTGCKKFLVKPVIALDMVLMLVSLAGLIGTSRRVKWLLWIYMPVMFLLMVLLFCFTIFATVVTFKGAGEVLPGRGYLEYRLGDYSNWLQKRVSNTNKWNRIKSCLIDGRLCSNFSHTYSNDTAEEFYTERLSALQSGCCKPSNDCNFTYVSPTVWNKTDDAVYTNPDCSAWANDPDVLCYNCQSCKAGLIQNVKIDGIVVALLHIVLLVFVIIGYSVGSWAFWNSGLDSYFVGY